MKYRRFGKTKIKMPIFSCGEMCLRQSCNQNELTGITEEIPRQLQQTVTKIFKLGMNHFETFTGYGLTEFQLGSVLRTLPRDKIIIQAKILMGKDSEEFQKNLETSFINLQIDYADLITIQDINNEKAFHNMLKCLDILEEWKGKNKIRHIGFSGNGTCNLIEKTIKTNRFDYVNLYYSYIFQNNLKAVQAAQKADMGIFIVRPEDKEKNLYSPPIKLKGLTVPLTPVQFNDLFCLANPAIHTLSIGTSNSENLQEHLNILTQIDEKGVINNSPADIAKKLDDELDRVLGKEWVRGCRNSLPDYTQVPDEINIPVIMYLYNIAKGFNMIEYGKMQYNLLGENNTWFPGNKAGDIAKYADEIIELCQLNNISFAEKIPAALEEAHKIFNVKNKNLNT